MAKKICVLNEATSKIDNHTKMSTMIVNLSHELKTPINVIRSAIDLLSLDYRSEGQVDQTIKELKGECNQVLNVVQTMIDIQRIKSEQINLRKATYNIVELVENVIEAFSEEYEACQLIFNPEEEEICSFASKELLQQAFMQLLYTMLQIENRKTIYIEMRRAQWQQIEIQLFHSSVRKIEQVLSLLNEFDKEEEMANILNIQFFKEIMKLHGGSIDIIKTEKGECIQLSLCMNYLETDQVIDINQENVSDLRESIRCHYLI